MSDDELDLDRLAHTISMHFVKRIVELGSAESLVYDAEIWQDAIVFVLAGEVEVECTGAERACFGRGATLALSPLPVRSVRNSGAKPARLLAISRRKPPSAGHAVTG